MRPTATNRKISWFYREDEAGSLDLSPEFQRRLVWQPHQASYLIDTILNGLPFPEVYIRSITSTMGQTTYQVVDGQQRIRAILDFAINDLILEGNDVSARWFGKSIEELSDEEKTHFWNYDVVVRELDSASDGDIRDLFHRLNISSVVLNDQELRHARYTGEFKVLMESLADDEWWTDTRVINVQQVRRMQDVEFISELFIYLMAGPQDKKKTIDEYYMDYDADFPEKDRWRKLFNSTIKRIKKIFNMEEIRSWSGKSDFYTLFGVLGAFVAEGVHFNKGEVIEINQELMSLRKKVDQAKRKDNRTQYPQYVNKYAEAVTRAATDIARRRDRHEVLRDRIQHAIKNIQSST